jgi:2-polyprenyl-6-methoxyphenol hydroxylase-like FAD-dependent oxidoreductase
VSSSTVVIAGAGPTGLLLACELGLAGVEAVVVERLDGQRTESPGVALNVAAVELLEQRGLLEPLKESAFTAALPRAHFALLPLHLERLTDRYLNSLIVTQDAVERVLEQRARELGAVVLRGHEVTGVDQDATGVEVTVRTAEGDRRIRAAYLVGCDGVDSTVRQLTGIGFPGRESPFYGLAGDIEVPLSELAAVHLGAYHSDSGGVYMCLPVGRDLVRLITAEYGTGPADPEAPVTWEETRETILRLTGTPLGAGRLRWMSRYRDLSALADRYREGRVLLAGDAAHAVFPLNGQAITTGLHDVVNLGWKLAATVRGLAPAGLLDTYHAERHPVGHRVRTNIEAQVSLSKQPEQVGPLRETLGQLIDLDEANRHLADLVMGLDIRYGVADPATAHPLLGRSLPPVVLKTSGGAVGLGELLAGGHGVVLDLSGGGAQTAAVAAGWADRVDTVTAAPTAEIDARALLLRPDGHIAWVPSRDGDGDAEGLRAALERWFGAPAF